LAGNLDAHSAAHGRRMIHAVPMTAKTMRHW
jgi:hypothetical protein